MEFKYVGPYDCGVEIDLPSGTVTVAHGDTFTVAEDEAEGLIAQPANFELVAGKPAGPSAPATTTTTSGS